MDYVSDSKRPLAVHSHRAVRPGDWGADCPPRVVHIVFSMQAPRPSASSPGPQTHLSLALITVCLFPGGGRQEGGWGKVESLGRPLSACFWGIYPGGACPTHALIGRLGVSSEILEPGVRRPTHPTAHYHSSIFRWGL